MTDRWTDRLSEYLDGELAAEERTDLEHHLAGCIPCRDALEELRLVVAGARSLGPSPPESDLWPAIAARIGGGEERLGWWERIERGFSSFRVSLSAPQLAAASLALVALTAAAAWWAGGGTERFPARPGFEAGTESTFALAGDRYRQYSREVESLRLVLAEKGDRLDPETIRVIEKNLKIIENAIEQSRQALARDPSNEFVHEHLMDSMTSKLELMREATDLALARADGA